VRQQRHLLIGIAGLWLVFLSGAKAQTLQVVDNAGHSTVFTKAQIAAMPHETVNVRDHGLAAQFEGVR